MPLQASVQNPKLLRLPFLCRVEKGDRRRSTAGRPIAVAAELMTSVGWLFHGRFGECHRQGRCFFRGILSARERILVGRI